MLNELDKLKEERLSQVEMYDLLINFELELDAHGYQDDEEKVLDALVDVSDYVCGWCSPRSALFSTYLSNEEIELYRKQKSEKKE